MRITTCTTLLLAGLAAIVAGCITSQTTLPDGTVVYETRIDWDEVQQAAERLTPVAYRAVSIAQEWEAERDARDAARTEAERELRRKQAAFVAGSVAFCYRFERDLSAGIPAIIALDSAMHSATSIVHLAGVDMNYGDLARELAEGADTEDYPSDVELALDILAREGMVL